MPRLNTLEQARQLVRLLWLHSQRDLALGQLGRETWQPMLEKPTVPPSFAARLAATGNGEYFEQRKTAGDVRFQES